MNKDMAIKHFRNEVMPTIKQEEKENNGGKPNYERREQYWKKYLDIALDNGWINEEKYNRWTTPPFCNSQYDPQAMRN